MWWVFILFSLVACQSQRSWEVSHLDAGDKLYNSSRLSYPIRDIVNGIGVEMVLARGEIKTYLEVHAQAIPPYQGKSNQALVKMKTKEKTFEGIAYRHEGGQRVTLSSELHTLLIDSLRDQSPVTILLEGYFTTIEPSEFSDHFQDFQNFPTKLPFQLPFKL